MRVAVVGGGIGGLAAAIALDRRGIEVEVFEGAAALAPIGASLSLGPNAVRLLDELGLGAELRRVGALPDTVDLLRWDDGSLLHRSVLGPPMEERFGAPQLDFFRPDLHQVLAGAAPAGALHLGFEALAVEQDEATAILLLADGSRVEADAVVAADGVRSPLRQRLVGAEDPVFSAPSSTAASPAARTSRTCTPPGSTSTGSGPGATASPTGSPAASCWR